MIARGADGLLLIGNDRSTTILNYPAARNVPALVAWAHDPEAALPSIRFDNFEAMCALARRVIFLGHKRIGLISAATESNDRARARVPAVRYAMEKAGISMGKLNVIETEYGIETGAMAFKALMNSGQDPTIVFCGNDVLAVGAMSQTQKRGLMCQPTFQSLDLTTLKLHVLLCPNCARCTYRIERWASRRPVYWLTWWKADHSPIPRSWMSPWKFVDRCPRRAYHLITRLFKLI